MFVYNTSTTLKRKVGSNEATNHNAEEIRTFAVTGAHEQQYDGGTSGDDTGSQQQQQKQQQRQQQQNQSQPGGHAHDAIQGDWGGGQVMPPSFDEEFSLSGGMLLYNLDCGTLEPPSPEPPSPERRGDGGDDVGPEGRQRGGRKKKRREKRTMTSVYVRWRKFPFAFFFCPCLTRTHAICEKKKGFEFFFFYNEDLKKKQEINACGRFLYRKHRKRESVPYRSSPP